MLPARASQVTPLFILQSPGWVDQGFIDWKKCGRRWIKKSRRRVLCVAPGGLFVGLDTTAALGGAGVGD